jgi:hypothetical protein
MFITHLGIIAPFSIAIASLKTLPYIIVCLTTLKIHKLMIYIDLVSWFFHPIRYFSAHGKKKELLKMLLGKSLLCGD